MSSPGLSRRGQSALGTFAGRAQASDGALVGAEVLLVLPLELVGEMRHHAVVKVFAAQMGVTGRRLNLENAVFDRQNRNVKRAAAQIEDQHVSFTSTLKQNQHHLKF